jgi:hypothetical protein
MPRWACSTTSLDRTSTRSRPSSVTRFWPPTRGPDSRREMIEALSAGVRDKRETAVGAMLTDILEATVPGYVRPNVCDATQNSRFGT